MSSVHLHHTTVWPVCGMLAPGSDRSCLWCSCTFLYMVPVHKVPLVVHLWSRCTIPLCPFCSAGAPGSAIYHVYGASTPYGTSVYCTMSCLLCRCTFSLCPFCGKWPPGSDISFISLVHLYPMVFVHKVSYIIFVMQMHLFSMSVVLMYLCTTWCVGCRCIRFHCMLWLTPIGDLGPRRTHTQVKIRPCCMTEATPHCLHHTRRITNNPLPLSTALLTGWATFQLV